MISAQQLSVRPGQTTVQPGQVAVQPGQLTVSPYATAQQFDIGELLGSIMPLVMLMMVMMSIGTHQALLAPMKDPASGNETPLVGIPLTDKHGVLLHPHFCQAAWLYQ